MEIEKFVFYHFLFNYRKNIYDSIKFYFSLFEKNFYNKFLITQNKNTYLSKFFG